jgi:hypothetical protein
MRDIVRSWFDSGAPPGTTAQEHAAARA